MIKSITLALLGPELLSPLLDTRDIVLFDQRGTFNSRPYLDCPDYDALPFETLREGLDPDGINALARKALAACMTRHQAAGVDLAAYNNVQNAADVNDVRAALGYRQIAFYGGSYGTLLGQHVMRDFPEILELVIFDSTDALSVQSWVENRAIGPQRGIDTLEELCAADRKCAEAFDITDLLDAAFALFDEGPIPATYTDANDPSQALDFEITEERFAEFIFNMQVSKYGAAALPATLSALLGATRDEFAAALGTEIATKAIAAQTATEDTMTLLMHFAMVCSDDPVRSMTGLRLEGVGRYAKVFGEAMARDYITACEVLDLPQLPDQSDIDVVTDVPVLILGGGLDIPTPTFLAEEVAEHLPDVQYVIFPVGFHVQLANINICAAKILRDFVRDPTVDVDVSCVAEQATLTFPVPDDDTGALD